MMSSQSAVFKEIRSEKFKKNDGTEEETLIFSCQLCGREWFSKGKLKIEQGLFTPTMLRAPSRCPCYAIDGGGA